MEGTQAHSRERRRLNARWVERWGAAMMCVYTAQTITIVANVRNVLEANGIPCVLRNEFLNAGFGCLPPLWGWPEVWVANDSDAERARQLIAEATGTPDSATEPWRCRHCGEEVDGIFAQCWNCWAGRQD